MDIPHRVALVMMILLAAVGCDSRRADGALEGIWEGPLRLPGLESRIVFIIRVLPDGAYGAVMLKPDENDTEVPVSEVDVADGRVHLQVDSVRGRFDGALNTQQMRIEGTWKQGPWSQPVVLKKVPEVVKSPRPQTPVRPFPYDEQEVTFTNAQAGARLAGTLTLPRTGGPFPTAILISGVGAHDRDCCILRHRSFLVLADSLTRRGVAVLRFDDRGIGRSTGDRTQATSAHYAQDALAGVTLLKSHTRIDPNRIGLVGHSEGGTIAALAAARSTDVAFIVMLGSPGLPGKEYNLQFEASAARALGQDEDSIAANQSLQERVLSVIVEEEDPAVAEARLRAVYAELSPSIRPGQVDAAMRRFLSPWFRFNVAHDPGATLETVTCPVLALFGHKDVQVPPAGNVEAVRGALERGGNRHFRVAVMPGLNHLFQTAATGSPLEYGTIEETISPAVLDLLATWITALWPTATH